MPDLPGPDFWTLPNLVGLVKYFCAHPNQVSAKSGCWVPWSPQEEYSVDPSWRIWLGQRDEGLLEPEWPSLADQIMSHSLECCSDKSWKEGKGTTHRGRLGRLQPWKDKWIIPGQSWCSGTLLYDGWVCLFTQIYFVDTGHNQCITNPRLLLEIKERFVWKIELEEGIWGLSPRNAPEDS